MRMIFFALPVILVSGCSDTDSTSTQSTEPDPNPRVETDPTAETGTGGPVRNPPSDGTVNGAPGEAPMKNQPTPTDN